MDIEQIARKAKELLGDTLFLQVIESLEARYISEWRNAPPADLQKREGAYASIRALEDIKGKLGSLANAPKVEAHNTRNAAKR